MYVGCIGFSTILSSVLSSLIVDDSIVVVIGDPQTSFQADKINASTCYLCHRQRYLYYRDVRHHVIVCHAQ